MRLTDKSRRGLATFAIFIATIAWGSSFFVMKDAFNEVPPAFLMALRFILGTLILSAFSMRRLRRLKPRDIGKGVFVGVFMFLAIYVQSIGLMYTTPGKNAFITVVYCVLVPFLNWIVTRKSPGFRMILCALLCFAGVGVVSLTEALTVGIGDMLTLVSGFLFACHIVALAALGRDMDPLSLTVTQFATLAVLFGAATLLFEPGPKTLDRDMALTVLYLALCPTILGYMFQTIGQKYVRPEVASIIFSLEAVFGVLFSAIFYGEKLTARMVAGFLMIFVAVVFSQVSFRRPAKE